MKNCWLKAALNFFEMMVLILLIMSADRNFMPPWAEIVAIIAFGTAAFTDGLLTRPTGEGEKE